MDMRARKEVDKEESGQGIGNRGSGEYPSRVFVSALRPTPDASQGSHLRDGHTDVKCRPTWRRHRLPHATRERRTVARTGGMRDQVGFLPALSINDVEHHTLGDGFTHLYRSV